MSNLMKITLALTSVLMPFLVNGLERNSYTKEYRSASGNRVIQVQPYNEVGGIRHYWNNDYYVPQPVFYDYSQNPYYLRPYYSTPGALPTTYYYNKTVKVSR